MKRFGLVLLFVAAAWGAFSLSERPSSPPRDMAKAPLEPSPAEVVLSHETVNPTPLKKNRTLSSLSEPEKNVEPQHEISNTVKLSERKVETKDSQIRKTEEQKPIPSEIAKPSELKVIKQLFYLWLGFGTNFISSVQTDTDGTDLSFQSTPSASHSLKVGGFVSKDLPGVEFSYKRSPGSVSGTSELSVINGQYSWETFAAETLFLIREDPFDPGNLDKTLTARFGIQHHFIPYFATQPSGAVEVRRNSVTNASLGVELILGAKHKVRYELLGRYQIPIAAAGGEGNTFSVTPKFAFDGSVGLASNLSKNLILGAYWYGQWNQYSFTYYDKVNSLSNTGRQSLFYTNFELRLGYVFE